ncbi:AAA family ATPase [Spirochaeta africana]|uniref:KaiC-like domain-containing protein n=1 Tax=Spirochaeta africana (strain ATCC 700263 / DSM 8902 / Z-7692) TaxID=889378 RepID=H9UMD4_SPIAZ|nr:AAA family ATPase [Spirochaeta africana]AFG38677.1 hypothetical protein Spiaf_2651 [Spirochaeta africana DSM 8902]
MVKSELVQRSPLRILEKSIHGGLGTGNIGVIAAPEGVGKTAVLVHLATDKLLQDKHVIHVSFSEKTDHIIAWYEDIYSEIARTKNLENAMDVHDEVVKNRVIMNFTQGEVPIEKMIKSVRAMIEEGDFAADMIIVDGFDFSRSSTDELVQLREFLSEDKLAVWFSASVPADQKFQPGQAPALLEGLMEQISVLVTLDDGGDHICLRLVKDHEHDHPEDPHLMLDAKSLLVAEDK